MTNVKGQDTYRHKVVRPKKIKLGWRNWWWNNLIEQPIIVDTNTVKVDTTMLANKYVVSKQVYFWGHNDSLGRNVRVDTSFADKRRGQMEIYLDKKGFFDAEVKDTVILDKKQRATVQYIITPGEPYRIRSYKMDSLTIIDGILKGYRELVEKKDSLIHVGDLVDQDILDAERERLTAYCRDQSAMFGFNKNYIGFVVDTTAGLRQADIIIYAKKKKIKKDLGNGLDTTLIIKHYTYRVDTVWFHLHNLNEASFTNFERYKFRCDSLIDLGLLDSLDENYRFTNGTYPLLDTLIIPLRGTFIYNEKPFINPYLLDRSNFLEEPDLTDPTKPTVHYTKEEYIERSYRSLSNLGTFRKVSVKVTINPKRADQKWTNVRYDLYPQEKHSFLIEPRLTNINGILGTQGVIGYTNKNIWRNANLLKVTLTGGFESQPLIVGLDNGIAVQNSGFINTFEADLSGTYTFPKLPFQRYESRRTSKRDFPKTTLEAKGNYQDRVEFNRFLVQGGILMSKRFGKTQEGELALFKINYVQLNKETFFEEELLASNDPQYINAFSNHMTTVTQLNFQYNNLKSNRRKSKHLHYMQGKATMAGLFLTPIIHSALVDQFNFLTVNEASQQLVRGVPFAQFFKIEGQYIASVYINKNQKIVYRAIAGAGKEFQGLSSDQANLIGLPYEYSFIAGGANDIRAFQAQTMAPGSVKKYADPNATNTQIGEAKFEMNLEWRFKMTPLLNGALFVDAGNIWNHRRAGGDPLAPDILKASSWREIALGFGYGLRLDMDFIIVRFDFASPIHNPYLPAGERWLWEKKTTYKSTTYFEYDPATEKFVGYKFPHGIQVNFGIGYPF